MHTRRILSTLAVVLLVTSLLPATTAQTDDLGIGTNDVRSEPQFSNEANGFPHHNFQPQTGDGDWANGGSLILEAYTLEGEIGEGADVDNIINIALHGNDFGSYEDRIYPGIVSFEAYWGWWTDTGGGDSLRSDQVTADDDLGVDAPDVNVEGPPNGAIDDADDEDAVEWDEFIERGPNPDASTYGQCLEGEDGGSQSDSDGDGIYSKTACDNDEMLVFMQPGTQNMHINTMTPFFGCACPVGATLSNSSDEYSEHEFIMEYVGVSDETWRQANGFGRYIYDSSLLMSTIVTTSVDPQESNGLYQPENAEAWDKDAYVAVDPAVETLYRTAVWDPNDVVDSPTDGLVHEEGLKEYAKEDARRDANALIDTVFAPVNAALAPTIGPSNDAQGNAYAQYQPVRKHEPNQPGDIYGIAADGSQQSWATYDSSTCYGDCQDGADADTTADFYEPGANQDYSTYATEEHFWGESKAYMDGSTNLVIMRAYGGDHTSLTTTPGAPGGDHTQLPGTLYMGANVGTWFDANGDTWVGNITEDPQAQDVRNEEDTTFAQADEDDPYASGLYEDPNSYGSDEFRGTCSADIQWTVEPMTPNQRWGTTGVYVYESTFDPYQPALQDATGGVYVNFPSPLGSFAWNDTDEIQGGGHLSRYVTDGPISFSGPCSSVEFGSGSWDTGKVIVFPTGSLEYDVKITFEATLTDDERVPVDDASNTGKLTGESIVDVDILRQIST